ncbi:MAG: hypothetical protein NT007_06910 [Candidatus Kapabacteria bacterium]|nr:hypothetical protein [Candidatus Kapabacteria bacterium]
MITKKNGGNVIDKDESNNLMGISAFEDIILDQNNPNPFSETTEINYYIPSKYNGSSRLFITDENGSHIINEAVICFGKPCQISFSAKNLITGIYIYGIEINGKLLKTKKMMIIK